MIEFKICRMSSEHLDGVMIVENLSFKIPWSRNSFVEELSTNQFAIYNVALSNNNVIGYAGMWKIFFFFYITNIAVHPEFRNAGVGSRLLESLLEICSGNDMEAVTLEVRKSNLAALHLYQKYGFAVEGSRRRYYADNGEDALIMWKHLK